MEAPQSIKENIQQAGDDLFNYAIDREDIKYLMALLPREAAVQRSKVDYELQLLKIVSVGWSISYHVQSSVLKNTLSELFWQAIHQFSHQLSQTTGLIIGQDIDYFSLLKARLDHYVAELSAHPDGQDPNQVIGRAFAGLCGDAGDLFAFMTGSKLFMSVTGRVKLYLEGCWEAPHKH